MRVKFYAGDYKERQEAANHDGAAFYFEGHANAAANSNADYALCVVATNASQKSIQVARGLANAWGPIVNVSGDSSQNVGYKDGVKIGGRGNGNLRYTDMPAVLGEPLFASNPEQALEFETEEGIQRIATALAATIRSNFPRDSLIAFSVGHAGKTSNPHDRGAVWSGARFETEADFVQAYMRVAANLLDDGTALPDPGLKPISATTNKLYTSIHIRRDLWDEIVKQL